MKLVNCIIQEDSDRNIIFCVYLTEAQRRLEYRYFHMFLFG